jgi:hypothetical protein
MAAVFGIVFGVVLVTRQTLVPPGSAALTTRDGVTVVQTAPFTRPAALSSQLADEEWSSLTQMSVSSATDNSWVRLNVLGTARLQGTGVYGSIIKARARSALQASRALLLLLLLLLRSSIDARPRRLCSCFSFAFPQRSELLRRTHPPAH